MNPIKMDDGNILIQYNHPAYNIVIDEFAISHMAEIKEKHLEALATDEVLMTPAGPSKFDELGMKALYGRAFMFMDAQNPKVARVIRRNSPNE